MYSIHVYVKYLAIFQPTSLTWLLLTPEFNGVEDFMGNIRYIIYIYIYTCDYLLFV